MAANGAIKAAYSSSLTLSGGTKPYKWEKISGTLPKGLELVTNSNGSKVTIKGTPTAAKKYSFALKVTDKNGATASKSFTVTMPYKWTVSSGALPDGLTLSADVKGTKVALTGPPKKAGTFKFTVKVTDKNSVGATKAFTVTITQPLRRL